MRKAKRFTAILLAAVLLGGCGSQEIPSESKTEGLSASRTEENANEPKEPECIDGFEVAEYEKFNSYASENGLDGTLIYIEGKVLSQNTSENVLSVIIEQKDGSRWVASVMSDSEIEEIKDKDIRAFGTYLGFSDTFNVPGIAIAVEDEQSMDKARIEVKKDGKYATAWSFIDYVYSMMEEQASEETVAVEESAESQAGEEYSQTMGEKNALKSAQNYLSFAAFSYDGLIDQLKYEQYSDEDAAYAADNCGADWNEQALKSAKNYLSFSAFSYSGLIQQLEYEKFTTEQATYAADNCGADWNEQASKCAKNYLDMMSFSKDGLIEQLEFEGFTNEQAVYGAEQNGY